MGLSHFSIGLSGIRAETTRVGVAADNISRLNVVGSERRQLSTETNELGGVTVRVQVQEINPAERESLSESNPNNINMVTELTELNRGFRGVQFNSLALNKGLESLGQLINMKI
ncbi:hypothetical protein BVY03_03610 [bacterium K02(2017)]|nr:hypothetical protein BVY03_03610 [bacterium K02(2017)]